MLGRWQQSAQFVLRIFAKITTSVADFGESVASKSIFAAATALAAV